MLLQSKLSNEFLDQSRPSSSLQTLRIRDSIIDYLLQQLSPKSALFLVREEPGKILCRFEVYSDLGILENLRKSDSRQKSLIPVSGVGVQELQQQQSLQSSHQLRKTSKNFTPSTQSFHRSNPK